MPSLEEHPFSIGSDFKFLETLEHKINDSCLVTSRGLSKY